MLNGLNTTYHELLHANSLLLGNYSQLQQSYFELNQTLTDHLNDFSEQAQNMRNLLYIYAITIAFFLIITVYLSKQAHSQGKRRNKTEKAVTHS
jgi:ABC-type phosphate transport system permease subunit